jgi:DNA polymerase
MSTELDAVYEELMRLKGDGLDRVFIDDATLALLKPMERPAPSPAKITDELKNLIDRRPETDTPRQAAPQAATPIAATGKPIPAAPTIELPEGSAEQRIKWLQEQVLNCTTCKNHLSQFGKIVFGCGNPSADIFFCGEAPGADEERTGEPFVGQAGQLLNKIIQAMGIQREEVYLTNILKWRPEHDKPYGNRPPTEEEMNFCLPYLKAQVEVVQPKVIIALGKTAISGLMKLPPRDIHIKQTRGNWEHFCNIPMMPTYHPSYLLHNNTLGTKREVWEDMLQVMEKVGLQISDKQRSFFLPKA